jgi:hypothetical protein
MHFIVWPVRLGEHIEIRHAGHGRCKLPTQSSRISGEWLMSEVERSDKPNEVQSPAGLAAFIITTCTVFIIKTCVVAIVITACAIYFFDSAVARLETAAAHTIANAHQQLADIHIGGRPFWDKVGHELDRAADPSSDLPPEKKQQLLNDLRVIMARWRPFIETVQNGLQPPAKAVDNKLQQPPNAQ